MGLQASFNLAKSGKAYFVRIYNLFDDRTTSVFHFDTGASVSLIGLNTICRNDPDKHQTLKRIIEEEISKFEIVPYEEPLQTVTKQELTVYPCRRDGVSIQGSNPIAFYFYIYLGHINLPLLGFDYIDDCSFHHSIGGDITVTGVANDVGKRFYPDRVIDFNRVIEKFNSRI